MIIYDKSFCNHCEKIFDFKNKFHDHIRSYEYRLLFNKSDVIIKIILIKLFIFETIFNNANIVIKKREIIYLAATSTSVIKNLTFYNSNLSSFFIFETTFNDANIAIKKKKITHFITTFIFIAKSIASHKSNLLTFVSVESFLSSTSLSIYRFILSLSPIYKSYKKLYFTIVNLYMRYASLSRPRRITNFIIIFLTFTIQDLYEKSYNKKKLIIFISNKTFDFSIKQYAIR